MSEASASVSQQELKSFGLKATTPRMRILELFLKASGSSVRHLTAEDVYKMLLAENLDVVRKPRATRRPNPNDVSESAIVDRRRFAPNLNRLISEDWRYLSCIAWQLHRVSARDVRRVYCA